MDDELAAWQAQFTSKPKKKQLEARVALLVNEGLDDESIIEALEQRYGYSIEGRDIRKGFSEAEIAAHQWRKRRRSESPRRRPPPDPRRPDHCDRRPVEARHETPVPLWHHDKFHDTLRAPSPEPQLPDDYVPPEPEWFSRAGGVCIPNPRAWLNEARESRRRAHSPDEHEYT